MSQRTDKKLRRLYKKDLGKKAQEQQKLVQSRIEEHLEKLEQVMKPAPRWIPDFIWVSLQKVFLNI